MVSRTTKWLATTFVLAGFALLAPPREARAVLVLEGTITVDSQPAITIFATDGNVAVAGLPTPNGTTVIQLSDISGTPGTQDGTLTLAPAGTIAPGYNVLFSSNFDAKSLSGNNINSNALQIVNNSGSTVTTNIGVGDTGFVGPARQKMKRA